MLTLAGTFLQGIGGAGLLQVLPFVAIIAVFYFLLIMPQQRRQKKWQEMLTKIKSGDKVVTGGGLTGTVLSVKDDTLVLRVPPDNIKIEIARSSVVTLTTSDDDKQLKS